MCVGGGPTPLIKVCKLLLVGFRDPVQILVPVPVAGLITLRTGAIVPADINDKRIVQLPQVINRIEEAPGLIIRVFAERSIDFGLARINFLFVVV